MKWWWLEEEHEMGGRSGSEADLKHTGPQIQGPTPMHERVHTHTHHSHSQTHTPGYGPHMLSPSSSSLNPFQK